MSSKQASAEPTSVSKRESRLEHVTSSMNCCQTCTVTSVNFVASFALLSLAALSYFMSMATKNWSASGSKMKMGLWDFCITSKENVEWTCFPVNTDFSVATQAFSILAAMSYACAFVLYLLYALFSILHKSRALAIGMCLIAFSIVSLQIMALVVYAAKNREMYLKIEKEYFQEPLDELYLSWSFYFAIVSSILSTGTGVLLFVEFRNLAYESLYKEPPEQTRTSK